jgi:hypothetical protein
VKRAHFQFLTLFYLLMSIEILFSTTAFSQTTFFQSATEQNKKRIWLVSGIQAYTEIGTFAALYPVWYAQNTTSQFHYFNDFGNWGNVDKYGHSYSAYQLSKLSSDFYRWAGVPKKKSAIIGSLIGLSFQSTLEIFDGFSNGYGFSWGDMLFNALGSGLYVSQELVWAEQKLIPKFSYHPTKYAALRPEILGSNQAERFLKDYNGQTYWLSFSPNHFAKSSMFPKWLCISIGYGIDGRIVGDQTSYTSADGITYHSKQQYYLSVDLDLKNLPIKNKTLKKIVCAFNYLKIPAPTVSFQKNKIQFLPIYF